MLATLTAVALLAQTPKISDLSWLAGTWQGSMFGGRWEENWSKPTKNAVQGHGRLIIDGETKFMEFMSIEVAKEGEKPTLYQMIGSPSEKEFKTEPFEFREGGANRIKFGRHVDDFPQFIEYKREGEKLVCELTGNESGKAKTERYEFKRA